MYQFCGMYHNPHKHNHKKNFIQEPKVQLSIVFDDCAEVSKCR